MRKILCLMAALALSACGGDDPGIARTIPPVGDLRVKAEPALPREAFETDAAGEPTEAALDAEQRWNDDVLIWGRDGWLTVGRICRWAENVAGDVPDLVCPPAPE